MGLGRKMHRSERRDPPPDALIVGLGNPGKEYVGTRHNVGFAVLDILAARYGASWRTGKQRALVTKFSYAGKTLFFAKPQTYMNVSGESVKALLRFHETDLQDLLVVYDELDLPLGTVRLKQGGGTAGHKGVGSVLALCGGPDFARVRVGIGKPSGQKAGMAYVLKGFSPREREEADLALEKAADIVLHWAEHGMAETQQAFH